MDPGTWDLVVGVDSDGDQNADTGILRESVALERTRQIDLTFRAKSQTIVELKLRSGATPLWSRPDLGIGPDDVVVQANRIKVKVHSLGSVAAPPSSVALLDSSGKALATAPVPALKAPLDLIPKTVDVMIHIPAGSNLKGHKVRIDPENKVREITTLNNEVVIQ